MKTTNEYIIRTSIKNLRNDVNIMNNKFNDLLEMVVKENKNYLNDEIYDLIEFIVSELGYDFRDRNRKTEYTFVRFYLANFLKETYKELILENIGLYIGLNDHASVIHAINQHKELLYTKYFKYINIARQIETIINNYELKQDNENIPHNIYAVN